MKVKITYTPEQENAAQATLNALRAMFPAARVHESVDYPPGKRYNKPIRHRVPPG